MRKVLVVLAPVAAAVVLCFGVAASASADTLDQQQTASDDVLGVGPTESLAQTFTAGISGGLDRVDLLLDAIGTPTAPVIVEIRDASSARPGLTILATGVIPAASVGSTAAFVPALFALPAPVTAGTQYAIVAYSSEPGPRYGWHFQAADVYSAGAMFDTGDSPPKSSTVWTKPGSGGGFDLAFKTFVTPPPPPATGQRAASLASCKKRAHEHHWSHKRLKKCKKKANLLPV